jgi:hypothetical protein
MKTYHLIILLWTLINSFVLCYGQTQDIDASFHHVRNLQPREWSEFPIDAKEKELLIHFSSHANKSDQTISFRQYDVKLNWRVTLNGHNIGSLVTDEKDLVTYLTVPIGVLHDGKNELLVKCSESIPDDIRIGEIEIDRRPLRDVLSDASVDIQIFDGNTTNFLPARITIVNNEGVLQTISSSVDESLAIRSGVVYTATGKALLDFPAGVYKIYVGRGFEYGVDSAEVVLKPGDRLRKAFRIRREVSTDGWISCDTHIHTSTHSGHGDATTKDRAITIAGEGVELPIITDHNIHVDITAAAQATGTGSYFTPVVGDELTTKLGHFNVFKMSTATPVIDHNVKDWNDVAQNIQDTDKTKAIILNHARDVHHNFRPFGPERHLSSAGVSKDDWRFPANAMEVINSGSQQTNFMNLYDDWFGMLNHGVLLTPVGSSDSHDVSRYIVGQGRTYIKTNDVDPGKIDVDEAISNFRDGKVMVSMGLLTKMMVNDQYGPGDLVPFSDKLTVAVEVYGPAWTTADRVSLFVNGKKIKETKIPNAKAGGLKWKGTWDIPFPKHDVFLVALAEGPGGGMPYWPIEKPYQPTSTDWTPKLIGSTGAVWIDGDKNKKRNSAYDYAKAIMNSSGMNVSNMIKDLNEYDEAIAVQLAALLWKDNKNLNSQITKETLDASKPETKAGFESVWKEIRSLTK